jgi:hypothetical protein
VFHGAAVQNEAQMREQWMIGDEVGSYSEDDDNTALVADGCDERYWVDVCCCDKKPLTCSIGLGKGSEGKKVGRPQLRPKASRPL